MRKSKKKNLCRLEHRFDEQMKVVSKSEDQPKQNYDTTVGVSNSEFDQSNPLVYDILNSVKFTKKTLRERQMTQLPRRQFGRHRF